VAGGTTGVLWAEVLFGWRQVRQRIYHGVAQNANAWGWNVEGRWR